MPEQQLSTRAPSPPRAEAIMKALRPQKEFTPKVLIGNWVEERMTCPRDLNLYHEPRDTRNTSEWVPENRQPDLRINKLNSSQGSMPILLKQEDACLKNFVSTNDLVYNHLTKRLCGPELRYYKKSAHIFHPQPDLMKCVGNLTQWGLSKDKEYEWKCTDVSDYISTSFQDTYVAPPRNSYVSNRFYRDTRFSKSFASLLSK